MEGGLVSAEGRPGTDHIRSGHTLTHLDLRLLHVVQQFTRPKGWAGPDGMTLRTAHSPRANVPTPLPAPRLGRGELGEQALPFLRAPQSSRAEARGGACLSEPSGGRVRWTPGYKARGVSLTVRLG